MLFRFRVYKGEIGEDEIRCFWEKPEVPSLKTFVERLAKLDQKQIVKKFKKMVESPIAVV